MKPTITIDKAQKLHKAGQLEEAKRAYLELLKANPADVKALHLLGIIYAEEGDLEAAEQKLSAARSLDTTDPILSLHLANILKAKGSMAEAKLILQQLIKQHPQFAAVYNNLGTIYFAEGKWPEAIEAFKNAIAIQSNYVDAFYNLALSLHKARRLNEAQVAYQALLELNPHHSGGQFQLGLLYMQNNQYPLALDYFAKVLQEIPTHFETLINVATCYLKQGELDKAKAFYIKALAEHPTDSQLFFNLGVIAEQQEEHSDAISYYLKALRFDADFYAAHNNLGVIFLKANDMNNALMHFREALRINPEDTALSHTIHALTHDKHIVGSPPVYITSLFDSYAERYDVHLSKHLHYRIPQLFHTALHAAREMKDVKWDILDLGCGTGLCGQAMVPYAQTLIGVDLSKNMLAKAEEKHIYTQLILADVIEYLANKEGQFDLIMAGDVLVYYGDLNNLFKLVYQALKPKGLFIFNVESTQKNEYELTQSGRFVHNKKYIDQLSNKYDFTVLQARLADMRTERYKEVTGLLYLLEKRLK